MSTRKLWGEFSSEFRDGSESVSTEFKKILITEALSMETERSEVPSEEIDSAYAIELPGEIGAMDETILHTVLLHPYLREIEDLLEDIHRSKDFDEFGPPEIPPVPAKPPVVKRLPVVNLSDQNARFLLRKTCATLLGHAGFDTTDTSALNVLTDVADEYLRTLGGKLRVAMDQTAKSGSTGFPCPLLRAFTEMNIALMSLQDHHQIQVKKYNETLLKRSRLLHSQCRNLVNTKIKERVKERVKEIVAKEEMEEENIPELHFPALGEDQLQSSLEPGFQMLDSLEHDESLQNLDNDEEIVVSDSPSHEYVMSTSSDFSSPTEPVSRKRKLL